MSSVYSSEGSTASAGLRRQKGSVVDETIRRNVWEAKVPIAIRVNEAELRHFGKPQQQPALSNSGHRARPFFTLALRTSYLPLLLPQLRRHFDEVFTVAASLTDGPLQCWLEWQGRPLAWHYPIGHLFDECRHWYGSALPWNLTLHFSDYPAELLPFHCDEHVEEGGGLIGMHFYAMLKQADYIRQGTGSKGVMALSRLEQAQLWDGLWIHAFDKFWPIYGAKVLGSEESVINWKAIPMRWYLQDHAIARRMIQVPASLQQCPTVGDCLGMLSLGHQHKVVSHGIIVPSEAPLSWLAQNLIYPDGFLHLLIVPNK